MSASVSLLVESTSQLQEEQHLMSKPTTLQLWSKQKPAYTSRVHDVVVGKVYRDAERLVIPEPVLMRVICEVVPVPAVQSVSAAR